MNINKILTMIKSKKILHVIVVILGLALLLGTYSVGMAVGFRKAKFSFAWGENYHKNFGGPRGGFLRDAERDFSGSDFIDAHGTFGQIIKKDGDLIIVKGKDNIEISVITGDKTTINKSRKSINALDLKIDDRIIIIGDPNNQGQIEAKFIRVF